MKLRLAADSDPCVVEIDDLAVRVYDALLIVLAMPALLDAASLEWLRDRVLAFRASEGQEQEHVATIDATLAAIRALQTHHDDPNAKVKPMADADDRAT